MKVGKFIESCDKASERLQLLMGLIKVTTDSVYDNLNGNGHRDFYEEIAYHFAVIEPVVEKYGNRMIPYEPNNEMIDIFRETLAVYDKSRIRVAELCLAELRMLKGKILVMYNNDREAEIDLSE